MVANVLAAVCAGRRETRNEHFRQAATVDLVPQRPPAVDEDGASDRLQQNAVLVRYLVRGSYKDAAWPIGHVGFKARGNQPHDLFVEQLPVTGVIFGPDHQVHGQSFQAPVCVGLDELAYQIDIGRVCNLQQHNRQIAGNRVAPQAGLPAAVLDENARVGAQRGIGVDHGGGQVCIELRIGFRGIELPQDHLGVCPRQIEGAIRETPILVFIDKA